MNWSLGWKIAPEADLVDEILLAAGKALYLANRFEAKCSYVLSVANLVDLARADPVAELEDLTSRLPPEQMLGRTLRDLLARGDMGATSEISAALNRARQARNYLAHEGAAALGDLYSYDVQKMLDALRSLRSKVTDVALADSIVSAWAFSIEEPHEPIPSISRAYGELVDDWIFGHMPTEWLDPNWHYQRHPPRTVTGALARAASYEPFYSQVHDRLRDKESDRRRRREIADRSFKQDSGS